MLRHLVGVATSLRSPLDVVLDLLSLFFVGISYLDALANLLLLRPIQRIKCDLTLIGLLILLSSVNVRVVDAIARTSFGTAWPVATLGCDPSLGLWLSSTV